MSEDSAVYRARAAAELDAGGKSPLPNVRERAERAAARWLEMAAMADKVKVKRTDREAAAEERRSGG
jgi:hypothetical protein